MRELNNLVVGWIDTNIRTVVEAGLLSRFSYVLISSIDSTTNLATVEMRRVLSQADPECIVFGSGVVVHGQSMVKLVADENLFTGFDELWCFESTPSIAKPDDVFLVAPFNIDTDFVRPRLVTWMAETDCKLGLGDGIGLNYATPLQELANILEALA
jgi:hypothetical protein